MVLEWLGNSHLADNQKHHYFRFPWPVLFAMQMPLGA
jgi:hypothetical protein